MKRHLLIALFFVGIASASAQTDDLNRTVDIAKEYVPLIERAAKLPIIPQSDDTTRLQPDFRYVITPRAWVSRFAVKPIRAAYLLADEEVDRPEPFYAKLGGGAPGQSLADIYLTSRRAGIYVNHTGQWADIDKAAARSTINSAGVFGRVSLGGTWLLGGELAIDHDNHADYLAAGRKLHYTTPTAAISTGNEYFDIEARGYILTPREAAWREESGVEAYAEGRYNTGLHRMTFRIGAGYWDAGGIHNFLFRAAPRYELDIQGVKFTMGAEIGFEPEREKVLFLPAVEFSVNGSVSPYIRLAGHLTDNSYRTLTAVNPYLDPSFTFGGNAPGASVEHTLLGGAAGRIGHTVAWNIYAGGQVQKNVLLKSSYAPYFVEKTEAFTAGADAEIHILGFRSSLMIKYLKFRHLEDYMPKVQAAFSAGYTNKKWGVRGGFDLCGRYKFYDPANSGIAAPTAADIFLIGEYHLSETFTLWAEGNNLAGQKTYPHALHRGPGASCSIGVKIKL